MLHDMNYNSLQQFTSTHVLSNPRYEEKEVEAQTIKKTEVRDKAHHGHSRESILSRRTHLSITVKSPDPLSYFKDSLALRDDLGKFFVNHCLSLSGDELSPGEREKGLLYGWDIIPCCFFMFVSWEFSLF
ncbi:hypothetical protein TNCV_1677561 [Trichonephila clavipes]|nr:hypothetical protein TNCV_1677561 [Trichonephila clavipes]